MRPRFFLRLPATTTMQSDSVCARGFLNRQAPVCMLCCIPGAQTCRVYLVVGPDHILTTDCSRFNFGPETTSSQGALVRLFWSAPECDYSVPTCPNESHQGGKRTRVRFNQTKKRRCENTLSLASRGMVDWRLCWRRSSEL